MRKDVCKNGHISPDRNSQGACKQCVREYMKKYRSLPYRKQKKQDESKERRLKNRQKAIDYLGGKCKDCGITDYRVLEFDHLRDKITNIARIIHHSWETVLPELEKCELVCSNCHSIRTWTRLNIAP